MRILKKTHSIITLDWDRVTRSTAQERCMLIYSYPLTSRIVWRMSSRRGYHIRVFLKHEVHFEVALRLRRKWHDDGNRIVLDILRDRQPKMVLWAAKYRDGMKEEATAWQPWSEI